MALPGHSAGIHVAVRSRHTTVMAPGWQGDLVAAPVLVREDLIESHLAVPVPPVMAVAEGGLHRADVLKADDQVLLMLPAVVPEAGFEPGSVAAEHDRSDTQV